MRILTIGGTGTLGEAVVNELSPRHEMIVAAHEHGDLRVDIAFSLVSYLSRQWWRHWDTLNQLRVRRQGKFIASFKQC